MRFEIADSKATVIKDSHYHKWLEKNVPNKNVHLIQTKVDYLKEQGFEVGTSFLSEDDLTTLKVIEQSYAKI